MSCVKFGLVSMFSDGVIFLDYGCKVEIIIFGSFVCYM